jgi:hypothetical protein
MRTFRRYSLSIAALLGSVPFDDIDCRGVPNAGDMGDRGSIILFRDSRGDGDGAAFSAALSRFNSSERCFVLGPINS